MRNRLCNRFKGLNLKTLGTNLVQRYKQFKKKSQNFHSVEHLKLLENVNINIETLLLLICKMSKKVIVEICRTKLS